MQEGSERARAPARRKPLLGRKKLFEIVASYATHNIIVISIVNLSPAAKWGARRRQAHGSPLASRLVGIKLNLPSESQANSESLVDFDWPASWPEFRALAKGPKFNISV